MNATLEQQVIDFTRETLNKAVTTYNLVGFDVNSIPIKFTLRGNTSGSARYCKLTFAPRGIAFHPAIIEKYGFDVFKNTIIHECAHLIANYRYKTNVGHGRAWQVICVQMGGNAERCHNYESPSNDNKLFHEYKCKCTTHKVTPRKHANIGVGSHRCRRCKCAVVYIGTTIGL